MEGSGALLIIPSREGKAGSFSSNGFWSSLWSSQAKKVMVGHLSPVWKRMRISGPRCPFAPAEGAVGQCQRDTKTPILLVH